ncbi:MAG: trehalose-phosphatase [Candidatus Acidiferrales bacterium]
MSSLLQPPRNLLASWSRVRSRIAGAPRVALFLDFDGTLVAYAPHPDLVRLVPATRLVLQRLARNPRVRVSIVSGRRRPELVRHVALPRVHYLGSYGWESGGRPRISRLDRAALAHAKRALKPVLLRCPSAWLEDKRFLLAIHYEHSAPTARRRMLAALRKISKSSRGRLRILENREDCELVPRMVRGKGHAVRRELAGASARATLPVVFGDNLSDESAFTASRRGITVRVGRDRQATRAHFRLRSPAEVAIALAKIDEVLR